MLFSSCLKAGMFRCVVNVCRVWRRLQTNLTGWIDGMMCFVSLSVEREGKTGLLDSTQPLLSSLVLTNCQSASSAMSRQKHQVILTDTRVCSHDGENLCLVSVVDAPSQMVCVCPKTSRDNGGSFFSQASCWRGLVRLCYLIGRLSWDVFRHQWWWQKRKEETDEDV